MLAATWSLGRASPLPRRTWTCRDDSGAAFGRTRHGTEEGNRECARGTPRRYRDHRATGHASTLARTPALETSCLGGKFVAGLLRQKIFSRQRSIIKCY